ncbi:MAG: exodeoxyribonuclease VII small subunit [Myxococcales bacterium]|nr:exodeoxyribonuclease VII small subunit [Myxococcales bacterium]MCB9642923.1 exodeoxyribonuclease VII small subunit [Myxococcales bacterium]
MGKSQSLEELFSELESVVEQLEEGEHALEESLRLFERGIWLCRQGGLRLDQAEQDVAQLVRDGQSGSWRREPWSDPQAQEASLSEEEEEDDSIEQADDIL